jgi:nitrogen fixation protein NifZ
MSAPQCICFHSAGGPAMRDVQRRKVRQFPCPAPKQELNGDFRPGDTVRALRPVANDGIYPHKDVGEIVVQSNDLGIIRERWSFLGEVYYTVEFPRPAAVVIMRGREMTPL